MYNLDFVGIRGEYLPLQNSSFGILRTENVLLRYFAILISDLTKSLYAIKIGTLADLKYLPPPSKLPIKRYTWRGEPIKLCLMRENPYQTKKPPKGDLKWRRNRDSNPRYARTYDGFQDRSNQPLWHSSKLYELVTCL